MGLQWLKKTIIIRMLNDPRIVPYFVQDVNNILLMGNDIVIIVTIRGWLSSTFEMKDIVEANYVCELAFFHVYSYSITRLAFYYEKQLFSKKLELPLIFIFKLKIGNKT